MTTGFNEQIAQKVTNGVLQAFQVCSVLASPLGAGSSPMKSIVIGRRVPETFSIAVCSTGT
jgi:hypothetical protein